jgi:glycosyltransferase involved in cell wall biosynthesis
MKRVLFLAYFFPPLGGGGVQRSLKFVRYLPELGWQPTVVTVRNASYWILDPSLDREIPPEAEVRRTFSFDGPWIESKMRRHRGDRVGGALAAPPTPARAAARATRLRRLASYVLVPDAYRGWKPFALREARRALREHPFEAIFSTASPETSHLVARDLALESGLPWVADFRDPWTHRIVFDPPTSLHARWHRRLERTILEAASHVTVTTDETRDDFAALHPSIPREKFTVIPNGFDREDFPGAVPEPAWDRFRLRYVGQLTAGRTVAPLLAALDRFFARVPARADTEVRLIGPRERENEALVAASGLGDVVSFEPAVPHKAAVRALTEAHVVLLIENLGPRAGLIAQGKLYECLYSERPILALVPPGAARRLVEEYRGGCAAGEGEAERAAGYLEEAHAAWRRRELLPAADRAPLGRFERRSLSRDLATLFDRLTLSR